MAWKNYMFYPTIKLEGHCMEKQVHNKLKKPSRSDDLLSSYSCSKFEKFSFEKNAFKDKSTEFIVINFWISYQELICYSRPIQFTPPLLRKAPAGLLKNVKKNRNFQNFKLVVPLKVPELTTRITYFTQV